MEIKLIAEIRESEKKAEEMIISARSAAEGRIKSAEDSFRSEIENLENNYVNRKIEIFKKAALEAEKCREKRSLEAELEIEFFNKKADTENDYIIGFLISKITGST